MLEKNKNQDFDLTLFFFIFSNPEYSYDLQSVNAKNNERNKKIAFLKLYQTILPNHELTIIWLSKIGKELKMIASFSFLKFFMTTLGYQINLGLLLLCSEYFSQGCTLIK